MRVENGGDEIHLPACLRRSEETVVGRDEPGTPAAEMVATRPTHKHRHPLAAVAAVDNVHAHRLWGPQAYGGGDDAATHGEQPHRGGGQAARQTAPAAAAVAAATVAVAHSLRSPRRPRAAHLARWVRTVGPCSRRVGSAGSRGRRPRPASPHGGPIQQGAVAATADHCGRIEGGEMTGAGEQG